MDPLMEFNHNFSSSVRELLTFSGKSHRAVDGSEWFESTAMNPDRLIRMNYSLDSNNYAMIMSYLKANQGAEIYIPNYAIGRTIDTSDYPYTSAPWETTETISVNSIAPNGLSLVDLFEFRSDFLWVYIDSNGYKDIVSGSLDIADTIEFPVGFWRGKLTIIPAMQTTVPNSISVSNETTSIASVDIEWPIKRNSNISGNEAASDTFIGKEVYPFSYDYSSAMQFNIVRDAIIIGDEFSSVKKTLNDNDNAFMSGKKVTSMLNGCADKMRIKGFFNKVSGEGSFYMPSFSEDFKIISISTDGLSITIDGVDLDKTLSKYGYVVLNDRTVVPFEIESKSKPNIETEILTLSLPIGSYYSDEAKSVIISTSQPINIGTIITSGLLIKSKIQSGSMTLEYVSIDLIKASFITTEVL